MIPVLQQSFRKLEAQKADALALVSTWSIERLRFQAEAGCWSALQIFDHVIKVEAALVSSVRRHAPEGHPRNISDRIRTQLVLRIMQSRLRVKVPASTPAVLPDLVAEPTSLFERWDKVRRHLATFVESFPLNQCQRGMFQHPVGGWMTVPQGMSFLSAHLEHHQHQIKRIARVSRYL